MKTDLLGAKGWLIGDDGEIDSDDHLCIRGIYLSGTTVMLIVQHDNSNGLSTIDATDFKMDGY